METLLSFLIILNMFIFIAPFLIWIFIKFASHHDHNIERKWTIIGISALVCLILFIIVSIVIVYIGLQIDTTSFSTSL